MTKNSPLVSPLRGWLGGKYRLSKKIIAELPQHHCYAEVFGGAAWVLFRKQPSKAEVINDINQDVINVYRCVKEHLPELLRQTKYMPASRSEFQRFLELRADTLTDIQRAARFMFLHRLSFGGKIAEQSMAATATRPPKFNARRLQKELTLSSQRLSSVMFECLNYDAFIERYDRPGTFFYIDPPYWDCEQMYGKDIFDKADFLALASQLESIRGKFLLSINDTPEVRAIFSKFNFQEVTLRYSVNVSNSVTAKELFVTNY